jgi:hypothetical protein
MGGELQQWIGCYQMLETKLVGVAKLSLSVEYFALYQSFDPDLTIGSSSGL